MSFITQVESERLLPTSEYLVDNLNVAGQKLNLNVYPTEGAGPFGVGYANAINEMSFSIGSQNCALIPNECFLQIGLQMGTTSGGVIAGAVDAVFDRVRIMTQQGLSILDEQWANLHSRMKQIVLVSNENKAVKWEENMDNLCHADSGANTITTTNKNYLVHFKQPFWEQVQAFPLPISGQLRLVLTMAKDSVVMSITQSDTYKVNSPRLNVSLVPYEFNYLEKLKKVALAGGLVLHYQQHKWVNAPNSTTNNVIPLKFGVNNAVSIEAVLRLKADETSATLENLGKYQIPSNDTTKSFNIYATCGSNIYPSCKIDNELSAYKFTKQLYGIDNDIDAGNQITRAKYFVANNTSTDQSSTGPFFIIGIDLRNGTSAGVSTKDGELDSSY